MGHRASCVRVFVILCLLASCLFRPSGRLRAAELARGDANKSGVIDLSDAIFVLGFLFLGTAAPACDPIADGNADGSVDIGDPIFILGFLFSGTKAPDPLSEADLTACGAGLDPAAIARGRLVYETPASGSLRKYACATCHADSADTDGVIYSASSLHDALARPNFKAGQMDSFLGAANTCLEHWMTSPTWTSETAAYKDILVFLQSITPPGPAPAVIYTIVAPSTSTTTNGDPVRGCELFSKACVRCHGAQGVGTTRAPTVFPLTPFEPDYIREKVRISGPTDSIYPGLIGGVMAFWPAERLNDADLEDITAYINARPVVECPE